MKTEIEVYVVRKSTEPERSVRLQIIGSNELLSIVGETANKFDLGGTYKISISEV